MGRQLPRARRDGRRDVDRDIDDRRAVGTDGGGERVIELARRRHPDALGPASAREHRVVR